MSGKIFDMFGSAAIALSSDAAEAPSEIQVIPSGYHETPKGAFLLSGKAADLVVADFSKRGTDMVIDYEHQSLTGDEAPAAGWIKELFNRGADGVWARVQWTARAAEYLRNREYKYLSPVFLRDNSDGAVQRLVNAALTNTPAICGMVPLVMKDGAGSSASGHEEEGSPLSGIASALGLAESADIAEMLGAIAALKQGFDAYGAIKSELDGLKDDLRRREASEMVAVAMKEGKVTPAQRDWAMKYAEDDPAGFGVFVMKAVRVAPIATGPIFERGPRSGALQSSVNAQMGMDEAKFAKFSKQEKEEARCQV